MLNSGLGLGVGKGEALSGELEAAERGVRRGRGGRTVAGQGGRGAGLGGRCGGGAHLKRTWHREWQE